MAEIETETDTDLQKSSSTRTIVRVSVGLILAVLLVLAVMDKNANTNATNTTDAWREQIKKATGENRQLSPADLTQYVVGSPEVTGDPADGVLLYTWSGTFRSYKTSVMCAEQQQAPVVVGVEGPSL